MTNGPQVDFDALAKKYGGTSSQNLDSLAAKFGGKAQNETAKVAPITDTSTFRAAPSRSVSDWFKDPGGTADSWAREKMGERGSTVGGILGSVRELLTGGQSAGKPMGTSSGILNNPVTTAISMAPLGASSAAAKIPSAERAGKSFEEVMGAAKSIPIDVAGPGNTALKIQKLAESGGTMPKIIRDFLRRATDPNKPPITYEEARDFYSNASRLSADELNRLTPVMKRAVGIFTRELNSSIEGAADEAGKLSQYKGAMGEYARAKRLENLARLAKEWAFKGALGYAGYAAAKDVARAGK